MIGLSVILDGDNAFTDLQEKPVESVIHVRKGLTVAALDGGMTSGKPSVMIRIDLPDGKTVLAETSMALFLMAANAFKAKFPGVLE